MKTYIATDINGKTVTVSAYTESDARQQANDLLGIGQVVNICEISGLLPGTAKISW